MRTDELTRSAEACVDVSHAAINEAAAHFAHVAPDAEAATAPNRHVYFPVPPKRLLTAPANMKRMHITFPAFAALALFSAGAIAQSAVQTFGILDVNLRNQKNGSAGAIRSMSQDGTLSSRLGFRGTEDLGGGLKAGFWIEGALNPDTGNPAGMTWQRRSTVSLMGPFGEVRVGRDIVPTYWQVGLFDPFAAVGVASALNMATQQGQSSGALNSGATTTVRANNTVAYMLPSALGGAYGSAMVSAGEGVVGNKYQGFRLGYGSGPANVALGMSRTQSTGGFDLKLINVGATYQFAWATLYTNFNRYEYRSSSERIVMLGVAVPLAGGTFKASYNKATGSGSGSGNAAQMGIGYVYELSRRTALYGTAARIDNEAGSRFVTSSSGPTNAMTGQKSTGYEAGIRHSF